MESGDSFESKATAADKLSRQATSSSFGSDDDSSNEDQVCVYMFVCILYGEPLYSISNLQCIH